MLENGAAPLSERLSTQNYNEGDCLAAIRGEKVPHALGLPLIRLCIIRGIRYHPDFATDLRGILPEFTRALNARRIMSNIIPDIQDTANEEIPYCIWYPDVASESTYRRLVQRFPQMVYQVARACAVAGYTDLYLELNVLPDVHVAEEARECGSSAIFDQIMAAPIRYSVMNDYTRSVDVANAKPADLTGDTAARWMLEIKQKFNHADVEAEDDFNPFHSYGFDEKYFNITEDMSIDEGTSPRTKPRYDIMQLLSAPLPVHLPTVDKDLLILMAAYYGDIDRYVRLRRPMRIDKEINCCVHGIYYNTMFAIWCSKQPWDRATYHPAIMQAVKARFVMNNVLAPIDPKDTPSSLPSVIANPTVAHESTYRALAKHNPFMIPYILDACVAGHYTDLFSELIANIDKTGLESILKTQAFRQPLFREIVERRMEELGSTLGADEIYCVSPHRNLASSTVTVPRQMGVDLVQTTFSTLSKRNFMNGWQCDISQVELLASLPDEWKLPEATGLVELDYAEWPPNWEAVGLSL